MHLKFLLIYSFLILNGYAAKTYSKPSYSGSKTVQAKPAKVYNPLNAKQPAYNPTFTAQVKPATVYNPPNVKQPAFKPAFTAQVKPATVYNPPNAKQPAFKPAFTAPSKPVGQNNWSNARQPAYNHTHFNAVSTAQNRYPHQPQQPHNPNLIAQQPPIVHNHFVNNLPPSYPSPYVHPHVQTGHGSGIGSLIGGVAKMATKWYKSWKKSNDKKTHNSTKPIEAKNPLLLSPKDSADKFPIKDLLNSYSPENSFKQYKDGNTSKKAKSSHNPFNGLKKTLVSNKQSEVHRLNLETKPKTYKSKPTIIVVIAIVSLVAVVTITGGVMCYLRRKKEIILN